MERLLTQLRPLLEIVKKGGIIVQGGIFMTNLPKREGQKYFKVRLEILKGKTRKGKEKIKEG